VTLPAAWYTEPAQLEREHEAIFARAWQYAGRAAAVAQPGDFLCADAGRVPVVVVRGRDGALRAFANVCRHRGHAVASGEGTCTTLQCPYHAWTYDLDGTLRAVPRAEREPELDLAGVALPPLSVAEWGPFVFVNPDPEAPPLTDALGDLPEVLAQSGIDLGGLRHARRVEWTLEANWKVAIENYLECYHCPVAHPGLAELFDVSAGAYGLHQAETFSWQTGPLRERRPAGTFVDAGEIERAQWHWLWPSTTVNVEAGPQNLSIDAWIPDGPGRTRGVSDYFFGEAVPEALIDEVIGFSAEVGAQDAALVASVQRGLASGTLDHALLMPESERLVAHFQRLVADAVAAAPNR
jgi:choline monooxygenase